MRDFEVGLDLVCASGVDFCGGVCGQDGGIDMGVDLFPLLWLIFVGRD